MANKITSFSLDEDVLRLLRLIAETTDRSQAKTLAALIKAEAKRLGLQ